MYCFYSNHLSSVVVGNSRDQIVHIVVHILHLHIGSVNLGCKCTVKMTTEVIILYTFQAILGIFGPCIAYLPVKYLNQKALGMQTVFDQMMKDLLYLIIFKSISVFPILALIVEFLMPVNHYLAIAITIVTQFSNLVILWQYVALIGVRFLSVFHPTYLQNENLIKTITRCFKLPINSA